MTLKWSDICLKRCFGGFVKNSRVGIASSAVSIAASLFLSLTMLGQASQAVTSFKKDLSAEIVVSRAIAPEAITLSDDGNQMTFLAKTLRDFSSASPPTTAFITKKVNGKWTEPQELQWRGMVTSIAFANNDKWLVVSNSHGSVKGYLTILKNLFGDRELIGNLENFKHRIEIYDATRPKKLLFSMDSSMFGLARPEMLKHARISADGKNLAFYTHGIGDQSGIYVYNFESKQTRFLGKSDDKHPTFTQDGSKLLFHMQSGGNSSTNYGGPEQSLIGYYEIETGKRTMLDSKPEGYAYHKHPSHYPGTDLIFFHGSVDAESSKKLFVRRLQVDSTIYKISDMKFGDVELRGMKHGNSSSNPTGLYFVGRPKDAPQIETRVVDPYADNPTTITVEEVKDIYMISNENVQKINRHIK